MNVDLSNPATLVAAKLIDRVLAGELPPELALEDWPESDTRHKALLNEAWSALQHFGDDADIHKVDAEYLDAERSSLKEYASKLRSLIGAKRLIAKRGPARWHSVKTSFRAFAPFLVSLLEP